MRITYACPSCRGTTTLDHVESAEALECPRCRAAVPIPAGSIGGEPGSPRRLLRCLVCPSVELFVRKDFPQRVGLAIVVAGLAASCVAWANRELVAGFYRDVLLEHHVDHASSYLRQDYIQHNEAPHV